MKPNKILNTQFNLTDENGERISMMALIEILFSKSARNTPEYTIARSLRKVGMSDIEIIRGVNLACGSNK